MSDNKFYGRWRITEMEMWDTDFIDAEVPGYIRFDDSGMGEFQFGYVHGFIDCRFSLDEKDVEFSWEGNDEMNPASGRGYATIDGKFLSGDLFFHQGEESGFKATQEEI